MVTVNHMNHDVAEVNGSYPSMLPGSFLYEKEPGYEERKEPGYKATFTLHSDFNFPTYMPLHAMCVEDAMQ